MGILDDAIREHLELKRQHGAASSDVDRLEKEAFGPLTRPGDPEFETGEEPRPDADPAPDASLEEPASDRSDWLAEQPTTVAPQREAQGATESPVEVERPPEPEGPPEPPRAGEQALAAAAERTSESAAAESPARAEAEAEPPEALEGAIFDVESFEEEDIDEPIAGEEAATEHPLPPRPEPVPRGEAEPQPAAEPADLAPAEPDSEELAAAEPPSEERRVPDLFEDDEDAPPAPIEQRRAAEPAAPPTEEHRSASGPAEDAPAEERSTPPAEREDEEADPDEDLLEETPDFLQDAPEGERLWFEQGSPRDFDFDDD